MGSDRIDVSAKSSSFTTRTQPTNFFVSFYNEVSQGGGAKYRGQNNGRESARWAKSTTCVRPHKFTYLGQYKETCVRKDMGVERVHLFNAAEAARKNPGPTHTCDTIMSSTIVIT